MPENTRRLNEALERAKKAEETAETLHVDNGALRAKLEAQKNVIAAEKTTAQEFRDEFVALQEAKTAAQHINASVAQKTASTTATIEQLKARNAELEKSQADQQALMNEVLERNDTLEAQLTAHGFFNGSQGSSTPRLAEPDEPLMEVTEEETVLGSSAQPSTENPATELSEQALLGQTPRELPYIGDPQPTVPISRTSPGPSITTLMHPNMQADTPPSSDDFLGKYLRLLRCCQFIDLIHP